MGTALDRTGPNRTPRQVSRTGVDGKTSSLRGVYVTSAFPPSGSLWSPRIVNKRQSTSPNFWKYDEFNTAVNGNLPYNLIVSPVLTQVFSDKLSNSSIRDLYTSCGMHLATDHANTMAPQFVTHGLSTINELNKGYGI